MDQLLGKVLAIAFFDGGFDKHAKNSGAKARQALHPAHGRRGRCGPCLEHGHWSFEHIAHPGAFSLTRLPSDRRNYLQRGPTLSTI